MKQTINENEFIQAFRTYGRLTEGENTGNFTREGLRALFEYLEEYEESINEELELDVISLCCEFAEYANYEELIQDYGYLLEREDEQTQEEYNEALLEELQGHTQVVIINEDEGHYIIGSF
jgi:hypothetical protein